MNRFIIPIITFLLFLSGCSNYTQYLSPNTKKHLYKTIQNEIYEQTTKGDISYQTGYLADAIYSYEMVNFYENKAVIPLQKIEKIKAQTKINSKHHYNLAIKYYKVDKKKALLEFNNVIKNTPNYKEAKTFIIKIKQNPKIIEFINMLEDSLKQSLVSAKMTTSHLKKINSAYTKLKQYDLHNSLLKNAYNQIQLQHTQLRDKAITLYDKGYLSSANKKFTNIKSIYKYDKIADEYLLMIKNIQENEMLIKKAQKALVEKQFIKAQKYAQEVLLQDSQNSIALKIMKSADKGSKEELSNLLDEGIDNYNNKNLVKALKNFQEVLVRYPDNITALIYVKKIKMQLQTIKSLE